ncbi:MAG: RNA-directed DNA polymerase [Alistipes sp.]|nr:RNA-directed DNA polymerase [Alistipes sp.]
MTSEERREARYQRRKQKRLESKDRQRKPYDDFEKVFSYDNLFHSYRMCRKNVRWKSSTQRYIANAPLNVYTTYTKLHNGTFESDGFYEFDLFERGKARHIRSVSIQERVVQRCLCDFSLVPMMRRTFIYDNGASLTYKGYAFAVRRIDRHIRWHYRHYGNNGYVLLFDFSSYFDSISHELLEKIIRKEYTDERLIDLLMHFIKMFGDEGLGLGSQISQVLALAAANELDHFIKEDLGIKCYGRYMDDGYLIHHDKAYLQECMKRIHQKCNELGLKLNIKKTRIVPIRRDFQWLKIMFRLTESGYIVKRIWHKSVVRMRRKMKKLKRKMDAGLLEQSDIRASYESWKSHTIGLDVYHTMRSMDELYNSLFGNEVTG